MDTVQSPRRTQNISLPKEVQEFARKQAESLHGGNVSHYIRSLIQADAELQQDGKQAPARQEHVAVS
jgi:Arc/MetJ-type ribon-helix-helix transcriptional regulator